MPSQEADPPRGRPFLIGGAASNCPAENSFPGWAGAVRGGRAAHHPLYRSPDHRIDRACLFCTTAPLGRASDRLPWRVAALLTTSWHIDGAQDC
jgi:hypothetical protein